MATKRRAAAEPTKVRLIRIRKKTGAEFWEIERTGAKLTVRTAPLYSKPKVKTSSLASVERAKARYDVLVAQARADGFGVLGELPAPQIPIARDEALEATIREHRADPAAYLVYADWLLGQGSPLGEMIVLATHNKHAKAKAIASKVGIPATELAEVGWRYGLWEWLHVNNQVDWSGDGWEPLPMLRQLFGSPLCAVLEHLRLGMLRWDFFDEADAIREAGRHGWARDLPKLTLGEVDSNIDMAHHAIGNVGKAITESFPDLVSLRMRSGAQDWRGSGESFGFDGLELPKLEELVIETCAMSGKRMKMLTRAKLPRLEKLVVWFGDRLHEKIARLADCAPLWQGTVFPRLRHLGLCNSEMMTDFVRLVPRSNIAAQLETLDLSKGTLDDSDALELAAEAARLPKLRRLNLDESFVTKPTLAKVKQAFPGVEVTARDPKERWSDDPDDRYVSVGE